MKEYKYKINGNVYKVTIGDIDDNIAHVEVNGTPYKVEMEKAPKVAVKPVVRPVAPAPAPAPVARPAAAPVQVWCEVAATGCHTRRESQRRRHRTERTNCRYPRSHEDGEQHQCRQGR